MKNETASQILDVAESMIREGGYFGFSFRQIADQLKIKSASVHYHYSTKEALSIAVAERYTHRFLEALGNAADAEAIERYVNLFKQSLETDGRACLCGILAGESGKLPDSLRRELQTFSDRNLAWLKLAFESQKPDVPAEQHHRLAMVLFSGLEGAMVFAALHGRPAHLGDVGKALLDLTTY